MLNKLKIIVSLIKYKIEMYKLLSPSIVHSFLLGIILDKLNINENGLPVSDNYHYNFSLGIFILSLICLLSFINVVGYLTAIKFIIKYNIESKYPKFKFIINYFEKCSEISIIIEVIICLLFLIFIVIFSLLEINKF